MIAFALETGTPSNSFLIFRMSLQNRLYAVFLDGTSNLGVFKVFTLKTFRTLGAFWQKLSLSSFPSVNSQSVLGKFWCMFIPDIFYQWKYLTYIGEMGISFFMITLRSWKFYSSSSWRMAGTPMTYNPSRIKSINLKWLYLRYTWPSSSNLWNAWILFELSISAMTSCSGKCQSNHLNLTYLLRHSILAT